MVGVASFLAGEPARVAMGEMPESGVSGSPMMLGISCVKLYKVLLGQHLQARCVLVGFGVRPEVRLEVSRAAAAERGVR